MKQFRQLSFAVIAVMIMMLASCQMGSVNNAIDTVISSEEQFGDMSVMLPSSRGWTVTKYIVTASRSGEKTVTKETTGTTLKMRLKVGKWLFTAVGYDSNNTPVFRSNEVECNVKSDNSSTLTIMLTQQSAVAEYTVNAPTVLQSKLSKITVTAQTAAGSEFTVSKEITSVSQKVMLSGLLTGYEYTITAEGFIGTEKYGFSTQKETFTNAGQTKTDGVINLNQTKVTEVTASPANGHSFNNANDKVTLLCGTDGAEIYYTTDGTTTPSKSSTKYTAPIALFSDMTEAGEKTIKAIAYSDGMTQSEVLTAVYTFDSSKAASPIFNPQGEIYTTDKSVTLTSSDGGTIKYSYDGTNWTNYSEPIEIKGSQTADVTKIIYVKVTDVNGKEDSDVVNQTYTISYPKLDKPSFTASKDSYDTETTFSLSANVDNASIYYTTNDNNPNTNSTKYTNPLTFEEVGTYTVKAIAVADGYKISDVETWVWTISPTGMVIPVTAITISPTSADLIVGGETATFTVTFTPDDANTDRTIQWSISDNTIASLTTDGTTATVTGLKYGTATLTALLTSTPTINATATLSVTTTTLPPVTGALGEMHPNTGDYSPVSYDTWGTDSYNLGANVDGSVTTFSLYSANATKVLLEIYDQAYGADAKYDYWMTKNTTTNRWQAKLSGNLSGAMYAFRVWGPNWTFSESWTRGGSSAGCIGDYDANGNRFNPNKVVFDPYAREITHDPSNADALAGSTTGYNVLSTGDTYRNLDSGKYAPKGYVITDSTNYGTKPQIPQKDAIIYEAHVRGITKHSSTARLQDLLSDYVEMENIPEAYRGTYKGATYMIPYMKMLGINTIELLPVHETDNDANPDDGPGGNFWGYMTFDYFAPDRRYSSDKSAGGPTREFKEMVKAFHDAGMEVYLDVVYNHSGEGGTWHGSDKDANYDVGKQCTVVSMRGIDNATYYSLVPSAKWAYWETTGCGNNLQCDNTYVRQFILDSLTYWIDTMGVDGFRFDLATTLGRVYNGVDGWDYQMLAQTLTDIAALGQTKKAEMIAESWDCGGNSYQVGWFPDGWAGWNGYYRDNVRGFIGNGVPNVKIAYSDGMYGDMSHFSTADPSINFICAHDGFTLADLCSYGGTGNYYNSRRTWPFGPSDGGNSDENAISTNVYVGTSVDEQASRRQRARNYFVMQMFSAGIPMIVYGDEFGRTQNGNNNPYNLDSVATWNNYDMIKTSSPHLASTGSANAAECGAYENMFGTFNNGGDTNKNNNFDFARYVMNERANNESLRQLTGEAAGLTYHKNNYTESGFNGDEDKCLGLMINGSHSVSGAKYYVMINMFNGDVNFTFPAPQSGSYWTRIIDTGYYAESNSNYWLDTDKICTYSDSNTYGIGPYRIVVLKEMQDTPTCYAPTISGSLGTRFNGGTNTITLATNTDEATIYYTTDGTDPSANNGTAYSEAFTITKTTTIKAIAVKAGYKNSEIITKTFTNTMVCNDPILSVPAGDFWNTITVFLTGDDTYYYTTDGSNPTTSSTAYTSAGIDISATTTLKVLAHDGVKSDTIISATYTKQDNPSITEDPSGVMLQGFNWDSAPRGNYDDENPSPYWYRWYNVVTARANDIKNRFEYMWCPPPSKTDTASSEGYAPTQLNDLNNCYGTAAELQEMISAISPTKAIADIVINHRAGSGSWGDFTNPSWCEDYYAICSDDEGFSASNSPMRGSAKHGDADTGDGYAAYRDLDHTNPVVQKGIYSWMNSVLKRAGFVGWRYDYVKGYGAEYVGYYNAQTSAAFSVGELWVDSNAIGQTKTWINGTAATMNGTAGQQSRAFDFPLKETLDSVFGYTGSDGIYHEGSNYYSSLGSGGLIHQSGYNNLAVTFVDNHDTGSTQKHRIMDERGISPAYVYLLTHPGMPCVAWQHYFSYADSGLMGTDAGEQYIGGKTVPSMTITYKELIDTLIAIRKSAGITTTSSVEQLDVSGSNYVVKVHGTNHDIIVKIGGANYTPTGIGWTGNLPVLKCDTTHNDDETIHAHGFAVWEEGKTWSDYHTDATTDVYFYNSNSWSTITAHVWNANGEVYTNWPGAVMTADTGSWYKLTIPSSATNVIFTNNGSDTGKIETTFSSETPFCKDGVWYSSKNDAENNVRPEVTFYCKIPTWINNGVVMALYGNGHNWSEINMTVFKDQWYTCTVEVNSLSENLVYQIRMKENNSTKYMKSDSTYNNDPMITPSTGYIMIDVDNHFHFGAGSQSDLFYVDSDYITCPAADPSSSL